MEDKQEMEIIEAVTKSVNGLLTERKRDIFEKAFAESYFNHDGEGKFKYPINIRITIEPDGDGYEIQSNISYGVTYKATAKRHVGAGQTDLVDEAESVKEKEPEYQPHAVNGKLCLPEPIEGEIIDAPHTPDQFRAALESAQSSDEISRIMNMLEVEIETIQRSLGLVPSCGQIDHNQYVGFDTVTQDDWKAAIVLASAIDPDKANMITTLVEVGGEIIEFLEAFIESEKSEPEAQPIQFRERLKAAKNADDVRGILYNLEKAIEEIQKSMDLPPTCGEIDDKQYYGFSIIKESAWEKAIKAANKIDPIKSAMLSEFVAVGKDIMGALKAFLAEEQNDFVNGVHASETPDSKSETETSDASHSLTTAQADAIGLSKYFKEKNSGNLNEAYHDIYGTEPFFDDAGNLMHFGKKAADQCVIAPDGMLISDAGSAPKNTEEQSSSGQGASGETLVMRGYYYNAPCGRVILIVHDGISNGQQWGTFYKTPTGSMKRLSSSNLPMMNSKRVAQEMLDDFAKKRGLAMALEEEVAL